MHGRIRIKSEPVLQEGQAVIEVKAAEACAGIVAGELFGKRHILDTEKAFQKGVKRDRFSAGVNSACSGVETTMTLAAPYYGALKPELQIFGWFEADLLRVYPGIIRVGVPFQTAYKKLIAERSSHTR